MLRVIYNMTYGADPEGFFERHGKVIGSEKIIQEEGLGYKNSPSVVRDGVQFEFNPSSGPSPFSLGCALGRAFNDLRFQLMKFPDVKVNLHDGVVEVDREELDSLSDKSRILGCQPSLNIYGVKPITVDPKTYPKRSAGGHFHIGLEHTTLMDKWASEDRRHSLIPFLDIFVGNTMVLLDRDPNAAERRENYGRAGEYRLPYYGVEYRTLSNFWLRNYTIMDLAVGLCRIATAVVSQSTTGDGYVDELVEAVDKNGTIDNFVDAINNNDFDLAMNNFKTVVRPFLVKYLPESSSPFPLTPNTLDKFLTFAEGVKTHGLDYFFKEDPMTHWCENKLTDFKVFVERV